MPQTWRPHPVGCVWELARIWSLASKLGKPIFGRVKILFCVVVAKTFKRSISSESRPIPPRTRPVLSDRPPVIIAQMFRDSKPQRKRRLENYVDSGGTLVRRWKPWWRSGDRGWLDGSLSPWNCGIQKSYSSNSNLPLYYDGFHIHGL